MAGMFGKKEKKEEDLDPELGPTIKMDVPSTFQGWCTLISRVLAPAEELSPFKLGQIQKLIADMCVSQPTPAAAWPACPSLLPAGARRGSGAYSGVHALLLSLCMYVSGCSPAHLPLPSLC